MFEIKIDLDKKCSCGEYGVTEDGYCLACVAKMCNEGKFDHIIKPIKKAVKQALKEP